MKTLTMIATITEENGLEHVYEVSAQLAHDASPAQADSLLTACYLALRERAFGAIGLPVRQAA